uniref:Uncharacterized protein n=1 Tax=Anguilla anguilla TaxID=7936 RepID=A0A0E9VXU8_ANGAN
MKESICIFSSFLKICLRKCSCYLFFLFYFFKQSQARDIFLKNTKF